MYKKYRYLNTDVHTYVQESNEYVRLLQHSSINKLSLIRDDNGKVPKVIINCSYFDNPYVSGRNQGDLMNGCYNNAENGMYCDLVFFEDGTHKVGKFNNWDYRGSNVLAGFSPATILIKDGADCELISTLIENVNKITAKNPQTAVAVLDNNKAVFIVSEGRNSNDTGLTGKQLRTFVREHYPNVKTLCQLDGGGSSEMIIDGTVKNYLSDGAERKMLNGLALIVKENVYKGEENLYKGEQNVQENKEKTELEGVDEMTIKVLDVSRYQTNIDYAAVKAAGIKGVILRCGRTTWGDLKVGADDCFEKHYKGFKAVGMPMGVYYYSVATTLAKAREEANFVLEQIKGKSFEYPIYYDTENEQRQKPLSTQVLTNITKEFCSIIEKAGYYAGIYAGKNWLQSEIDLKQLPYDVWVAHYASKCGYTGSYGMWQYTDKGTVKGISGNVDLNYCYKDYPAIIKKAGLNHLDQEETMETLKKEVADLTAKLETANRSLQLKDIEIIKLEDELAKVQAKVTAALNALK